MAELAGYAVAAAITAWPVAETGCTQQKDYGAAKQLESAVSPGLTVERPSDGFITIASGQGPMKATLKSYDSFLAPGTGAFRLRKSRLLRRSFFAAKLPIRKRMTEDDLRYPPGSCGL